MILSTLEPHINFNCKTVGLETYGYRKRRTLAFSCGARSAFNPPGKRLLESHAVAPSAARLCWLAQREHSSDATCRRLRYIQRRNFRFAYYLHEMPRIRLFNLQVTTLRE